MTTSAAERVFGVAELLEMVLASLPLKDMLLVQRVSKDFRNGVKSSKRLQEALFLRPAKICGVNAAFEAGCARELGAQVDVTAAGASNKWLVLQKKLHHRRIHPVPLNPLLWQRTRINKSSFDTVDSLPIESIQFLHPAIGGLSLDRHSSTDGEVHLNVILEAKTNPSDAATAVLEDSEASWRQMLVKQCPCTTIVLGLRIDGNGVSRGPNGTMLPADATLGEIMDWCQSKYAIFTRKGVDVDSKSDH